jgi:hypothetical protein
VIESLKPYLQVASALSEIARDRARETARHALAATPAAGVLPGATTVETVAGQIGALADELVSASRANRAMLTDLVRAEVESVLSRMGLTQQAELQAQLAATNARVRELERELAVRDAQDVGTEAPPPPPPAPTIRRDSVEEDAEAAARQAVVKRAATKKAATKKAATTKAATKKTTAPQAANEMAPEPAVAPSEGADAGPAELPGSTDVADAPAAKRATRKSSARKTSASTETGGAGNAKKGATKKSAAKTTTAKKSSARQPTTRRGRTSAAAGQSPLLSVDAAPGDADGAP